MDEYGVLVVDDSAFMRKSISSIIEASPNFFVIGKARNGRDAIEKIKRLKPSIVTLDIEMPELDGLETLKILMEEMPVPVIMLSNGVDDTLQAFEYGAVDFVIKKNLLQNDADAHIDFHNRLTIAATAKIPVLPSKNDVPTNVELPVTKIPKFSKCTKELLVIGSSTGGPSALQMVLTKIPATIGIPVVIVQHMPPGFTKPLADRFNNICSLPVKEAEQDEMLQNGVIYIAPAGIQTMIVKRKGDFIFKQQATTNVETLYKPSIDVTLLSTTTDVKEKLLVVILTGMGDDGLRGCRAVKKNGGTVIAESEETCVVYGMPKVVFEAGLVDQQQPLPYIFDAIMSEI